MPRRSVRAGCRSLAAHDDRRLVVELGLGTEPIADAVHEPRARPGRRSELGSIGGSQPSSADGRSSGGFIGLRTARLSTGEVCGQEVADGHVEVQQQADDREQREDDPGAWNAERAGQQTAHARAEQSPALPRIDGIRPRPSDQVEHPEDRECEEGGAGGGHPSFGGHRLHPQHQRESGQQRRSKRNAPAKRGREHVVPGLDDRPGIGREEGDHAQDGEEEEHEREALAHEASAQHERRRLTSPPRRPAPRRRPSSRCHPGQTSITIGRIIGRRFVRWWKNRLSVSRICVLTKPASAACSSSRRCFSVAKQLVARFAEQRVFGIGQEAAADDVRLTDGLTCVPVEGDRHHDDSVRCERPPVAEDDPVDPVDGGDAVDEDGACGNRTGHARPVAVVLDDLAVLEHEDLVDVDAGALGEQAVLHEHPVLAVDRDEVARLDEPEHELQLFSRPVPGDVAVDERLVVDHRPFLEEVVDGLRDGLLVAGNRRGRHDDRVARLDRDVAVVAVAHAGQAAHRLALRSGRHDDQLFFREALKLVLANHRPVAVVEVAALEGDRRVLLHAPPERDHLPAVRPRGVDHLLDATDVARERRHDHPALRFAHEPVEALADGRFGERVALLLGARRVGEEELRRRGCRSRRSVRGPRAGHRAGCGRT